MEFISLIFASIIFILFFLHCLDLYRLRRMPPGPPIGLPIIGNLLDIGRKPHKSLANLSKKHGPLMTIRLGSITTVIASTSDVAREILQHNDVSCSGRPIPDAVTVLNNHDGAITWIPTNDLWRTIRKALNMYLTNKHKLDNLSDLRQNVVDDMLVFLHESGRKKEYVNIGKLAFEVALNMMSNTCLSKNVTSYKCDEIGGFKTAVKKLLEVDGKFNIADLFPVLKPLDPQNIRSQAKVAYDWLDKMILGFVNERLKHRELKHPRVREEVSTTLDNDGKIHEAKILDLPYLHAVIKETMRLHIAVPLLVPHKAEKEVKLGEYIVPKNTQILVNTWAIARDSRYWDDPLRFKPERFLGSKVEYMGQDFEFLPFGSGRRMCPGIPLAYRVVSLMVASFVYHFDWKLPHSKKDMDMNDIFGISLLRETPLRATPIPN